LDGRHRRRSERVVAGAILTAALFASQGCLMLGGRFLGDEWAPVEAQGMYGFHVPIPVGKSLIASLGLMGSIASEGSDEASVGETAIGIGFLAPGSTTLWSRKSGFMLYAGGGFSSLSATASDYYGSMSGSGTGLFAYAGAGRRSAK
jgi:hypothetical protein